MSNSSGSFPNPDDNQEPTSHVVNNEMKCLAATPVDPDTPADDEVAMKETVMKLYQKLEECFFTFMNEVMKQYGEQLSGTLKGFLECAVCKEVLIQAVSRNCKHTFCHHCVIQCLKSSPNCPICRDKVYVGAKNPWIDRVVDLLVDVLFTEEEKSGRSVTIQQRSTLAANNQEDKMFIDAIETLAIIEPNVQTSFVGKHMCFMKAKSLLVETFMSEEMQSQVLLDEDESDDDWEDVSDDEWEDVSDDDVSYDDDFSIFESLLETFLANFNSLMSILSSLSPSLRARYMGVNLIPTGDLSS